MHNQRIRRATVLAAAGVLLGAAAVFADTIKADGDVTTPAVNAFYELEPVTPGTVVRVDVAFQLDCGGTRHVDANQTVTLTLAGMTLPLGGRASGTPATISPPGANWPVDGAACPLLPPLDPIRSSTDSHVTLTAPMTIGTGNLYTLSYLRSLSPTSPNDTGTFSGSASNVTFSLDVVPNQPPVLSLPGDMTVEGTTTGGAHVTYSASATDREDNPDPAPVCAPASGSFFAVGETTTVSCTVTDSAGAPASGSFRVTVVDTTAPTMSGLPADQRLVTNDPNGATVSYKLPTATDVVDPTASVTCTPASGSMVGVGYWDVRCVATDASGNSVEGIFGIAVHLNAAPVLTVPADISVEGDATGGAHVTFAATATDDEDVPDPAVSCSRASGSLFGLGTTTVSCDVTDADGKTAKGTFNVTVVDTTAPMLSGGTTSLTLTTTSSNGATIAYTAPSANDIVDASPNVSCSPASGSVARVGDSWVNCTATDASGNAATSKFPVHVTLLTTDTWSATWEEPIGPPAAITANAGRTLPVKLRIYLNGVEVVTGSAFLRIVPCAGPPPTFEIPLAFGGRWTGKIDTSVLTGDCYRVAVIAGTTEAGSFRLDLAGATPVKVPAKGPAKTTTKP
jgi:HYR domain-containing protein